MSFQTVPVTPELHKYILENSLREPALLRELREETAGLPEADMQIAPDQGQLMALLIRISGARRILEIGTFTGYSSTVMALAMPPDGRITCLDRSREYTDVARRYWKRAGVEDRISLRLGPAEVSLRTLIDEGKSGTYDAAFIDADKGSYETYYEACLELIADGGLIMLDNMLWEGRVVHKSANDEDTAAIRRMNAKLHSDSRVDVSLVPIADGLTLARKRIPGAEDRTAN